MPKRKIPLVPSDPIALPPDYVQRSDSEPEPATDDGPRFWVATKDGTEPGWQPFTITPEPRPWWRFW